MGRLLVSLLSAAGALAAAGCAPEGSYQVTWGFVGAGGQEELAPTGCGAHGVDAIRILGVSSGGSHDLIAACTAGGATGSLTPGTWLFGIHALGLDGKFKEPLIEGDEMSTTILHAWLHDQTVPEDGRLDLGQVWLTAQPECEDDVDNDRDGRVDSDDPSCPPTGTGETEAEPPPVL